VVGGVLAVVWFGLLGFVLVHGKGEASSVDVYSELPPGFTTSLQQQGVTYAGLSPVDDATVQQVLTRATTDVSAPTGSAPIVLRTAFTGDSFTDQPALMVVVPNPQFSTPTSGGGATSPVFVAFVDPTTYKTLTTVTYDAAGVSG